MELNDTLKVAPEVNNPRLGSSSPGLAAFGGGQAAAQVSEAADGLISGLAQISAQHDHDANQMAQQEAENAAVGGYHDLLYGRLDENGEISTRGLKQYQGKAALAAPAELLPELKKHLDSISEAMPDPRQKLIFARKAVDIMDRFHGEVLAHVGKEIAEHDKALTAQTVAQAQTDAANHWQEAFDKPSGSSGVDETGQPMPKLNPVQEAAHKVLLAVQETARRQGEDLGGPEVKGRMLLEVGKLHAAVLREMANAGDDVAAARYFKEHKGEIPEKAREGLEKVLATVETVGQARRKTEAILTNPATANDYNKQIEAAAEIENEAVRKKVTGELKQNHFVQQRAEADEQAQIYAGARTRFLASNMAGSVQNPSVISVSDWARLSDKQKTQLQQLEAPVTANAVKSLKARKAFMRLGTEGIAKLDQPEFDKFWLRMNERDRKATQEIFQAAKQGKTSQLDEALLHNFTGDRLVANTGEKSPSAQVALHQQLAQSLATYQATHKSPADPAQVQVLADQVATQHLLAKRQPQAGIDSWLHSQNLKTGTQLWNQAIGKKREMVEKIAPPGASAEMKGRFLAKMLMEEEGNLK